jgi:hypothetical protein
VAVNAWPNLEVNSREFKLTLVAGNFSGATPATKVASLWTDIQAQATSISGVTCSGTPAIDTAKTPRDVLYYDTAGTCLLKNAGLQFRSRQKGSASRSITVKVRSPDRYLSSYQDVAASTNNCPAAGCLPESKFEEDITPGPAGTSVALWKSQFSHSNTRLVTDGKTINDLQDIDDLWSTVIDQYGWTLSGALTTVSGLTVVETVYTGGIIQLTSSWAAEVDITLWTDKAGSSSTVILAEYSFKIQSAGGSNEDWSSTSVTRMNQFFKLLQSGSFTTKWNDPAPDTKTNFVYDFAAFCT